MPPRFTARTDFLKPIMEAELSDVTRKIYLERWRVILQHHQVDIFTILTQPKKYIAWIKNTYESLATQKSYLSAVLAVFRHNVGMKEQRNKAYRDWYAAFQAIHDQIDERYKRNEPSSRQKEGYVPFEEVVKARDRLEKGTDERLLLSIYTHIPPLRADFNRVRLYEGALPSSSREKNYIHLRDAKAILVLREFKTAGKMDDYEKELPQALVEEIEASVARHPRDYLFEDREHKPYRASTFNKWANRILARIFGKNLTISLMRHSFINSLDFNKLTVAEKEAIARDMTHTVGTQDRYRLIFGRKE
jgi:hypothetical protein